MKKFTKICLQVIGVCLVLGIVLIILGTILGGYSTFRNMITNNEFTIPFMITSDTNKNKNNEVQTDLSTENSLSETKDTTSETQNSTWNNSSDTDATDSFPANDIKALDVNLTYGEIKFVTSDDANDIKVEAQNTDSTYSAKKDGDTLTILDSKSYNKKYFDWNVTNDPHLTIIITLPKDKSFTQSKLSMNAGLMNIDKLSSDTLDLSLNAGQVEINQLNVNTSATLSVNAGKMDIKNGTIKNLNLSCGTGQAVVKTALSGESNLDCSVGEIDLTVDGNKEDFNYDISCDIGQIDLMNDSYSGLNTKKHIDQGANKSLSISCNVGHVNVTFQ